MTRPGSVMTVRPPSCTSRRSARNSSRRRGPGATAPDAIGRSAAGASEGAAGSGVVTCGARWKAGATVGGAFCTRSGGAAEFGPPGTEPGAAPPIPGRAGGAVGAPAAGGVVGAPAAGGVVGAPAAGAVAGALSPAVLQAHLSPAELSALRRREAAVLPDAEAAFPARRHAAVVLQGFRHLGALWTVALSASAEQASQLERELCRRRCRGRRWRLPGAARRRRQRRWCALLK